MNNINIYDLFKPPDDLEKRISDGCKLIKKGDFSGSKKIFSSLLADGADNPDVEIGLMSVKYWDNREYKIREMEKNIERGKFLIDEWEAFKKFINEINKSGKNLEDLDSFKSLRYFIMSNAVDDFIEGYKKKNQPDIDLLLLIGLTFLELPDFEKAIETLEYARVFRKKDPYLLSLLAYSYYGYGDITRSKVLFRESFFLNPEDVPLEKIKCKMLDNIIIEIKEHDIENIAPWIPVFGIIMGEFNIIKELTEEEAGELIQEVIRLEKDFLNTNSTYLLPYLLSKYLFLIDYLDKQMDIKNEANSLRDKIKTLAPEIYNLYIKYNL